MDRQQLTIMANKFQSVFDASRLDARGHDRGFCQRQRLITPFRFGLSVVASMASQQVHSMADVHRAFTALWDREVSYKAFYYYSEPFNCMLCGDAQMTPIPSPGRTSCSRLLARKVRCSTRVKPRSCRPVQAVRIASISLPNWCLRLLYMPGWVLFKVNSPESVLKKSCMH